MARGAAPELGTALEVHLAGPRHREVAPGPSTRSPRVVVDRRPALVEMGIVAGLLVAGIGMPAVLAAWTHVFGIPRNDDWAYRRVLLEFVRTGHYAPVGWGSMTLVGQVLWAAPFVLVFGAQTWVPGVSVAVAAAIGLVAAYLLARSFLRRGPAAACTSVLLVFPGFLLNTSSFMTDVPAFAAEMVCLVLGVVALRGQGRCRWASLGGSMTAGAFGFGIREFDLAAPVAVVVVLAWQNRRRRGLYLVAGAGLVLVCGAVFLWTSQLPGVQHKALVAPSWASVGACAGAYFTLAFALSPVLPVVVGRSWRSAPRAAVAVAALALGVGLWLMARHQPVLIGNYLTQKGATGPEVLNGARPNLFPGPIWNVLEVAGIIAGAALAFAAVSWLPLRRRRPPVERQKAIVLSFSAFSAGGLMLYGLLVRAPLWDRYLWPVAFGSALLLLGRGQRLEGRPGPKVPAAPGGAAPGAAAPGGAPRLVATVLALPAIVVALTITLNADAYDGARWSAGQDLVKAGYPPTRVDAGFEWVGSHAAVPARPGRRVAGAPSYETWYDQMFPGFRDCAFVSGSPTGGPALELMRTVSYDAIAFAVPERLYLYALITPACRVVPPPTR